jgi:hypothetical protein
MQQLWMVPFAFKKYITKQETTINKLYYLRPMRFIVENSPSFKFCLDLPLYNTAASHTSN